MIYGAMESLIGPEEVDPEVISLFKNLEAEQKIIRTDIETC